MMFVRSSVGPDCCAIASSEFFSDGKYKFEGADRDTAYMVNYSKELVEKYPLVSIEDPLDEDQWDAWIALTAEIGDKVQLVGDDLFVTNPERLQRGIDEKAGNALVELSTVAEEAAETFRLKAQVENAHDLATLRAQLAIPAAPAPTTPKAKA